MQLNRFAVAKIIVPQLHNNNNDSLYFYKIEEIKHYSDLLTQKTFSSYNCDDPSCLSKLYFETRCCTRCTSFIESRIQRKTLLDILNIIFQPYERPIDNIDNFFKDHGVQIDSISCNDREIRLPVNIPKKNYKKIFIFKNTTEISQWVTRFFIDFNFDLKLYLNNILFYDLIDYDIPPCGFSLMIETQLKLSNRVLIDFIRDYKFFELNCYQKFEIIIKMYFLEKLGYSPEKDERIPYKKLLRIKKYLNIEIK